MDKKVEYTLVRKSGLKRIYLRIKEDGSLEVTAPMRVSKAYIDSLVIEKESWYEKRLSTKTVSHNYKNGDIFTIIGKNYTLETVLQADEDICIAKDGRLILFLKNQADDEKKKQLIRDCHKRELLQYLKEKVPFYAQLLNVEVPQVRINNAAKQWGSCSAKRQVSFSVRTAGLNREEIDYIIVHELCHILHMDHSKEFWAEVERIIPDRKALRKSINAKHFNTFI